MLFPFKVKEILQVLYYAIYLNVCRALVCLNPIIYIVLKKVVPFLFSSSNKKNIEFSFSYHFPCVLNLTGSLCDKLVDYDVADDIEFVFAILVV